MAWRRSGVRIPIAPLEKGPARRTSSASPGPLFFRGDDPPCAPVCARLRSRPRGLLWLGRSSSASPGPLFFSGGDPPVPPGVRSLALAHLVCGVARWARSAFAGSLFFSGGRQVRRSTLRPGGSAEHGPRARAAVGKVVLGGDLEAECLVHPHVG